MPSIKDETHERYGFAFAELCTVGKRQDVCEFGAAWWGLAPGNAGLVSTGVAQITEGLQRDGSDLVHRRAEIVFHRILLVVGRALVTAGVAAKKIYLPWLVGEGLELKRERLATFLELQLLRKTGCRQ